MRLPYQRRRTTGSAPIQLELCDSNAAGISSCSVVVTATSEVQVSTQTTDTVEDAGNSNPDSNFRFSSTLGTSGGYIFNLSTAGMICFIVC